MKNYKYATWVTLLLWIFLLIDFVEIENIDSLYLKKFVILFGDVSETIDHADRVRYLREYKRGVEL